MSRQSEIIAKTVDRLECELDTMEKIFSLAHTSLDVDDELAGFTNEDWAKVAKWEEHLRSSFTRYYERELRTARQKVLAGVDTNTREDFNPK